MPVIRGEGPTALAANGDSIRITGNPAFSAPSAEEAPGFHQEATDAADEAEEDPRGVGSREPDLDEAINSVPPIPVSKEQLAKNGCTSCEGHKFVIVGHKPKAYRTPAPRHPRCDIRTTWLLKDGAWSTVEDRISLEEIPNKTAKLEDKVVMSLTSFEKSREDPADIPDSDLEDPVKLLRHTKVKRAPALDPPLHLKGRAPLRSKPVSFEGGIAHESSAETAANAQVQDSGTPECTVSG